MRKIKGIVVEDKDFERQNILMSQTTFNLNPVGTKMSDAKILPFDQTPVGEKTLDLTTPTLPTKLSKQKQKAKKKYVPEYPESEPCLSDS